MTPPVAPRRPWVPADTRRVIRGRLVVRTRDERSHIPHRSDVTLGASTAASRLDVEAIDRELRRASPAMRVTRVFHAAHNVDVHGARHLGYDADEIGLGLSRTFHVELDPETAIASTVEALRGLDTVEHATPVYLSDCPFGAAAGLPGDEWARRMIRAAEALAREPGDPAVIVAIVDSGIRQAHLELRGRCRTGVDLVDLPAGELSRSLQLIGDLATRDHDTDDDMGHGTECAGIIGALGLDLPPGIAGLAQLLPIRVLAAAMVVDRTTPTAIGSIPDIDAGVKTAVDLGARVLNLSFGTPESALGEGDPIPHTDVVQYALRRGCVLVSASGNSGDETRYFPACLPGVIAVGAVDATGRPSHFSTRGDHVALCAPGEHVRTAALTGTTSVSGTSFAAPFVAGAAALVLAAAWRRGVPLSPFTVRDLLMRSARPFSAGVPGAGCGRGVLDVAAALAAVDQWSSVFDDEVGQQSSAVVAGSRLPCPNATPGTHPGEMYL